MDAFDLLSSSPLIPLVGASDLARARDFYAGVLGLPVVDEDPHAVVVESNGTRLRITAVGTPLPPVYSVLSWRVADIAATVDGLAGRGVVFARYDGMGMEQDERGVWTAPNGTRVAWFLDPDGNNLSLSQDPPA